MKFYRDYFPLIISICAAFATIISNFFSIDKELIYSYILISVTITSVIYFIYQEFKRRHESNIEQKPGIWSLITNELLSEKRKGFLTAASSILVISDSSSSRAEEFIKLRSLFSENVQTKHFASESSNNLELQKGILSEVLEKIDAIILIRTINLEMNSWVYQSLDDWALKNSHIPCLVIDLIDDIQKYKLKSENALSEIPDKYNIIPHEPLESIPWRLLTRANERALAWRSQANFNRIIFFSTIIIGCMALFLFYNLYLGQIEKQKIFERFEINKERYSVKANNLKNKYYKLIELSKPIAKIDTTSLTFSYWLPYTSKSNIKVLYQLGTSENKLLSQYTVFNLDTNKAIGCAFKYTNKFIFWNSELKIPIIYSNVVEDTISSECINCKFYKENNRPISGIICFAYTRDDTRKACAICIDTKDKNSYSFLKSVESRRFLLKQVTDFYDQVYPSSDIVPNDDIVNKAK
jgi:hypothetical protein